MKVPENRENSKMSWKNTGCLFESLHSVAPAIGSGSYIVISKTYQKHTPWYNIHGVLITSSFRRVWQLYYINITTVLKTNTNHTTYCWYCGWKKILHQLIPVSSLSHHLRCCIHPKWCRISSSNRSKCSMYTLSSASSMNSFLEMWLLKRGQWLLDKNICRLVSVEVIGRDKYIENTKIPYMFFSKKTGMTNYSQTPHFEWKIHNPKILPDLMFQLGFGFEEFHAKSRRSSSKRLVRDISSSHRWGSSSARHS